MAACQFGRNYVQNTSISISVADALDTIKKHLYPAADFLQGSPAMVQVSQRQAVLNPRIGPSKPGVFFPDQNKLVLVQGSWCVETPIHETLHAVSSIQLLEEAFALKPLFEGLTDCLTGYLLNKAHPHTYSNCWKTEPKTACSITYLTHSKLWGAFFHFVPLKSIIPLYLETPPDWYRMCRKFAAFVKQSHPNFRDVLSNVLRSRVPITDMTFRNECERAFGRRFTIISRTPEALEAARYKL